MALSINKVIDNDDVSYWLIDEVKYDKVEDSITIHLAGFFDIADRMKKFPVARARDKVQIEAALPFSIEDAYNTVKSFEAWSEATDI